MKKLRIEYQGLLLRFCTHRNKFNCVFRFTKLRKYAIRSLIWSFDKLFFLNDVSSVSSPSEYQTVWIQILTQHFVRPVLGPNCLQTLSVFILYNAKFIYVWKWQKLPLSEERVKYCFVSVSGLIFKQETKYWWKTCKFSYMGKYIFPKFKIRLNVNIIHSCKILVTFTNLKLNISLKG